MFQVPWLPEFIIGLNDYRNFNAIFRGQKAVSYKTEFYHSQSLLAYSLILSSFSPSPSLPLSLPPSLSLQGVKNKASFPPDVVEAYKYTFSKPGALTGPINYIRAIYNTRHFIFSKVKKMINVPTLLLWVSV